MTQQAQKNLSFGNEVLAALPENELRRLAPHLKKVKLRQGEVLHEADSPPDYGYFLEEGVAGLSVSSEGGKELNLSIVGNDSNYTRGNITILNRAELENAACECYEIIKKAVRMKQDE